MSESISGMAWVSASSFPLAMVFYAISGFILAYSERFDLATSAGSTRNVQKIKLSTTGKILLIFSTLFMVLSLVSAITGVVLFFQSITGGLLEMVPIVLSIIATIALSPWFSRVVESYRPSDLYDAYKEEYSESVDPDVQQKNNHALWEKLHQQLPQFLIGGVFCLATANAQHRCEFLSLLSTLATAEDCRDVWGYFHGHPLPHVRAFHQRLCTEFDGADYDDPIVQDALTRLMREAGMYGWLVMGQVAMPEDADNWHSGFAYAETFGQALADLLRWAERAREAQA